MGIPLEFGKIQGFLSCRPPISELRQYFLLGPVFKIRGYVSTSHSAGFLVSETSQQKTAQEAFRSPPPLSLVLKIPSSYEDGNLRTFARGGT